MLNAVDNNLLLFLQSREKFINATKHLLDFFDYLNDDQILNECTQIQELNSMIDQSTFIEWNKYNMTHWTNGCKRGHGGHFLEDGHLIVANKVIEYFNKLT
jgi:hypothetical protein